MVTSHAFSPTDGFALHQSCSKLLGTALNCFQIQESQLSSSLRNCSQSLNCRAARICNLTVACNCLSACALGSVHVCLAASHQPCPPFSARHANSPAQPQHPTRLAGARALSHAHLKNSLDSVPQECVRLRPRSSARRVSMVCERAHSAMHWPHLPAPFLLSASPRVMLYLISTQIQPMQSRSCLDTLLPRHILSPDVSRHSMLGFI